MVADEGLESKKKETLVKLTSRILEQHGQQESEVKAPGRPSGSSQYLADLKPGHIVQPGSPMQMSFPWPAKSLLFIPQIPWKDAGRRINKETDRSNAVSATRVASQPSAST